MDIVISHKDKIVFNILETKSESDSHTKWAVIIVVKAWNERGIFGNETRRFHKLFDSCR